MKRWVVVCIIACLVLAFSAKAQDAGNEKALSIDTKELQKASLWTMYAPEGRYGFSLRSSGGVGLHRWRIALGSLPRGMKLEESGQLRGAPEEAGDFNFIVLLSDGTHEVKKPLVLRVERPLSADWSRKSQVNGNRIDGSIKVSNTTGRDFDLTFAVLAVNDIGRATAIGYQHFTLKKNTRDIELPFGDTLAPGSYVVNIDVVAEEPQSNMIFRSRMVAPKQTIAPEL